MPWQTREPRRTLAAMAQRDPARGKRISQFRELAGLTQEDVARAVGVSVKTAYLWEKGAGIQPANLRGLSDALDRSLDEIRGQAETPDPFRLANYINDQLQEFRDDFKTVQEHMARQDSARQDHADLVSGLLEQQSGVLASMEDAVKSIQGLLSQQTELLQAIRDEMDALGVVKEALAALEAQAAPAPRTRRRRTGT